MGKDKERTLQIMSAVKELMWVVIDIITNVRADVENLILYTRGLSQSPND